jgi:hypothetical protein
MIEVYLYHQFCCCNPRKRVQPLVPAYGLGDIAPRGRPVGVPGIWGRTPAIGNVILAWAAIVLRFWPCHSDNSVNRYRVPHVFNSQRRPKRRVDHVVSRISMPAGADL